MHYALTVHKNQIQRITKAKGIKCDRHRTMRIEHEAWSMKHQMILHNVIIIYICIRYSLLYRLLHAWWLSVLYFIVEKLWTSEFFKLKTKQKKPFTPNSWSVMLNHCFTSFFLVPWNKRHNNKHMMTKREREQRGPNACNSTFVLSNPNKMRMRYENFP